MNPSTDPLDELGRLAAALCDGEITPAEAARLEQLANRSSQTRRFFLQYLQLHGELCWENAAGARKNMPEAAEAARRAEAAPARPAEAGRPAAATGKRGLPWLRWTAVAAASLAVAVLAGVALHSYWAREAEPPSPPPAVARVIRTFQVESPSIDVRSEGSGLAAGRQLDLRAGFAEIRFRGGARAILKGPASLRLDSPSQARLLSGSLTADLTRRPAAFTVQSEDAVIVHRGTQFGVAVAKGEATEVHVFDGAVRVHPRAGAPGAAAWHEVGAAEAVRVAPDSPGGSPHVRRIEVDSSRFVRDFPAPGRVVGFRALVAEHPDLIHHYTFEGLTERERRRDKRGELDLVEVVMVQGRGAGALACGLPGVDPTTLAVQPYRDPAQGNTAGVALQSEATTAGQAGAWLIPPKTFTVELLLSFAGFAGAAEGQVAAAVATRTGERECGFFVAAVDRGRLVHLMDGDAPWVASDLECLPGEWYYVASTFRVADGRTVVNTYAANLTRRETQLKRVVGDRSAAGEPAAGPLGIGKGFAANLAHAYAWPGMLDEVAIYRSALSRETLASHLEMLTGTVSNARLSRSRAGTSRTEGDRS